MNELRFVPGFSIYGVSADGNIYNTLRNRWLGLKEPGFYVTLNLMGDDGKRWITSRHRFVARAWLGEPPSPELVVNHKNGIKGDDRAENLEWVSQQYNLTHGGVIGFNKTTMMVEVRNFTTKETMLFESVASCARHYEMSRDMIQYRIGSNGKRLFDGNLQYRRQSLDNWPENPDSDFGREKRIYLKDTINDSITVFESQREVSAWTGMCEAVISNAVKNDRQPLLMGRYLIQRESSLKPWREIKDRLRESRVTRAVVVTNVETGEEKVYPSAKECANAMSLLPTTLAERLKRGGSKVYGGFTFNFY